MNVNISDEAMKMAKDNKVKIRTTKIIYHLIESVVNIIEDSRNIGSINKENKGQARVKSVYEVKTKLGI